MKGLRNYLTAILLLLFPPLVLGLLAAPTSQYGILSAIGLLSDASEDILSTILSLSTLFEILLLCLLFILGVLLLLMDRVYNRRFLSLLTGILVSFQFLLGILSLTAIALSGRTKAGNIVCFLAVVLFLVFYWLAFFLVVERDYRLLALSKQWEQEQTEEKEEARRKLERKIESLHAEGKIGDEDYHSLLDELNRTEEKE